ncbi:MAG: secretin N-terminal domain-containing protein, partial [bacterium]
MKKAISLFVFVVFGLSLSVSARSLFLETAVPTAPAPRGPRVEDSTPRAAAKPSYNVRTYQMKYSDAGVMAGSIQGVLAEGESASVNDPLNMLLVRASEATQNRLTKLLERLDVPPLQVQVEAKIIELKQGAGDSVDANQLGVSWKYRNPNDSNDSIQNFTTQ